MSIPETFLKIKSAKWSKSAKLGLEVFIVITVLGAVFFMGRMSAMAQSGQNLSNITPTSVQPSTSGSLMQTILGDSEGASDAAAPQVPPQTSVSVTGNSSTASQNLGVPSLGNFAASKSGKVYYPISCKGLNRVKPANRIYFSTETAAQNSGRTLSKTCQ